MASTNQCPYCGSVVRSDERNCPGCGAANELFVIDAPSIITQPRTIEELQEYCAERGMPLLRMRFFIGEDYRGPKAFGIYRDGKNVVVYKNKADGSRAVRYRGRDETHAVNEIFQKLQDECRSRGIDPDRPSSASTRSVPSPASSANPYARGNYSSRSAASRSTASRKPSAALGCLSDALSGCLRHFVLIFIILIVLGVIVSGCSDLIGHGKDGYYHLPGDDRTYYNYGGDWYYSFDTDDDTYWYSTDAFPESDYDSYSLGDSWSSDWGVSDFRESDTWDDLNTTTSYSSSSNYSSWDSSDSDWSSSDSDWSSSDYDSWDSSDSDWDSDW